MEHISRTAEMSPWTGVNVRNSSNVQRWRWQYQ